MGNLDVTSEVHAADIDEITSFVDDVASNDARPALSDHLLADLHGGGSDGFAAITRRDTDRRIAAYGQVSAGNEEFVLEVVVRPDRRRDAEGLVTPMVDAALDTVADHGGGRINWWVSEHDVGHRPIAERAGLRPGRELHQMRIALPTGTDVTVTTRPFVPGEDDEAWVAVNNRAFADHGEQGGWTVDMLRQRRGEPWFDAQGFLLHDDRVDEADDVERLAAFCWTKVHPATRDDPRLGEIYVIAVDPDFHGRGLGSQMTLAGLDWLANRGIDTGMLYVDADNTTAVGMYERIGFTIHSTRTAYIADIDPTSPRE